MSNGKTELQHLACLSWVLFSEISHCRTGDRRQVRQAVAGSECLVISAFDRVHADETPLCAAGLFCSWFVLAFAVREICVNLITVGFRTGFRSHAVAKWPFEHDSFVGAVAQDKKWS